MPLSETELLFKKMDKGYFSGSGEDEGGRGGGVMLGRDAHRNVSCSEFPCFIYTLANSEELCNLRCGIYFIHLLSIGPHPGCDACRCRLHSPRPDNFLKLTVTGKGSASFGIQGTRVLP